MPARLERPGIMALLDFLRRKKVLDEAGRRALLLSTGRIVEGVILDTASDDQGAVTQIFYRYEISGVEYESSQSLDDNQRLHTADYTPGARIIIRYDPRQPVNSVVV